MKTILVLFFHVVLFAAFTQNFTEGEKVFIEWQGQWYLGKIEQVEGDEFVISYDGYDASWNERVGISRLKPYVVEQSSATNHVDETVQYPISYLDVENIWDLALSPDGNFVLAASAYGKLKILDVSSMSVVQEITLTNGTPILTASWSHDGKFIATGFSDGNAVVYAQTDGEEFVEYATLEGYASIFEVRFNPVKLELAVFGSPKSDYRLVRVDIWDIRTKKMKAGMMNGSKRPTVVTAICYSPDGNFLAIGHSLDKRGIEIHDSTGRMVKSLKSDNEITCLDYSPDGKKLASGTTDLKVNVWDISTGIKKWCKPWRESGSNYVYGVSFSPDGKTLAVCGAGSGSAVRLYDVFDGTVKDELGTNTFGNAVEISNDNAFVYCAFSTFSDLSKVPVVTKYKISQ
jgi:WD40 repeat protein